MSNVLIIKHLPTTLVFQEKEQLLKHFGADKVWETSKKRNYVFASFSSTERAKSSLQRLHQLEVANRRLVVEYSFEKVPLKGNTLENEKNSSVTKHVKEFLSTLNAWNPSVNFYQAPPIHLKYKYPEVNTTIAVNIVNALFTHKPFYTQTLHLMNKMSLQIPFSKNDVALQFFKETFSEYFIGSIPIQPPESDPESEISSDEGNAKKDPVPKVVKRQHTLPKTRKRPAAVLSTAILPKIKKTPIAQEEVFESVTNIQEPKKISLVVSQDALQKQTEGPEITGELGKFEREDKPVDKDDKHIESDLPTISRKELRNNRLSYNDMRVLPVFKNYHPGLPSMRLYIKNLAKTVTEQDVKRIYKMYIEHLPEEEQLGFDVRVMQEGKMKGQAFVTFPSTTVAEGALRETNGFILKDKPMVVQFARVANKKTVD